MRRRSGSGVWVFLVFVALGVFLLWQYRGYRLARRTLPPNLTVAGLSVAGKTREQLLNELEVAFATPLELRYVDQSVYLFPETVQLTYDAEETAARLDAVLKKQDGFEGFIAYILRRPSEPVDVPVAVAYSPERVSEFLTRVAAEYDRPPQEPVLVNGTLTFKTGQPGYQLDLEASRLLVARALASPVREPVELVVHAQRAAPLEGTALEHVLMGLLDAHSGLTGGIFAKDLMAGTEVLVNADVAFSGLSTMRVALIAEVCRLLDPPLPVDILGWISGSIGATDGISEADRLLIQVVGAGDGYRGAEELTVSMKRLGLVNTFIMAPFSESKPYVAVATPANLETKGLTRIDPRMQTTPLDMGLLLEMIYQCAEHNGGTLILAYPGAFDAAECRQILEWLSANRTNSFIEAGVPPDVRVAHQQGLSGDTHADVGIVFGEKVPFVLAIFLYRSEGLSYEESAPLITDIATATYNYFHALP